MVFSKYVCKYLVIYVKSYFIIVMGFLYFLCRFIVREKFLVLIYIIKIIYMVENCKMYLKGSKYRFINEISFYMLFFSIINFEI